jgi:hypothetical protein
MRALHAEHASGGAPPHRYALSDFGLTPVQVTDRFAGL